MKMATANKPVDVERCGGAFQDTRRSALTTSMPLPHSTTNCSRCSGLSAFSSSRVGQSTMTVGHWSSVSSSRTMGSRPPSVMAQCRLRGAEPRLVDEAHATASQNIGEGNAFELAAYIVANGLSTFPPVKCSLQTAKEECHDRPGTERDSARFTTVPALWGQHTWTFGSHPSLGGCRGGN
jgi:hypothetical protein